MTTLPAPTTETSPILLPLSIIELHPIKQFFPIIISFALIFSLVSEFLYSISIGWKSLSNIFTFPPIKVLSPIVIPFLAYIVAPEIPTLFPILILASFVLVTIIVLWYNPIKFDRKLLFIVQFFPIFNSDPLFLILLEYQKD